MSGVALTGAGHVVLPPGSPREHDPRPWLRIRKNRKYMALQDDLAVVAAAHALRSAGLSPDDLGERAGLYLVVGSIPFGRETIVDLLRGSLGPEGFSMQAFSTEGVGSVSPLLTFHCLPNMPAFHVSATFDVQGPYTVSYAGPGQLYPVFEQALLALHDGRIDVALVGAVADQRSFLVQHHLGRLDPPVPADRLADAAGLLVLEREEQARARGATIRARPVAIDAGYEPLDPFEQAVAPSESFEGFEPACGDADLGAASLPVSLSLAVEGARAGQLRHRLRSRDGVTADSLWEIAP